MRVCVIEVSETITRDSGVQLEGGEGEVSPGLFEKLKSTLCLEKMPDYIHLYIKFLI